MCIKLLFLIFFSGSMKKTFAGIMVRNIDFYRVISRQDDSFSRHKALLKKLKIEVIISQGTEQMLH